MGVCNRWTVVAAVVGALVAATFAVNGRLPELQRRDMSGQVVVITGGTGGIGRETARTLAHWGAHVIIGARNESKAQRCVACGAWGVGCGVGGAWGVITPWCAMVRAPRT